MSIISSSRFIPHPFSEIEHGVFPNTPALAMYEQWCKRFASIDDIVTERIDYESGGFKVRGFKIFPAAIPAEGLPILVFNRGGMRHFGLINVATLLGLMIPFARKGYIVLTTQYRGNDGSEGMEEFGGAEIEDVLTLLDIGKEMPEWNRTSSFMAGWSRGGMMTYLALKKGAAVNAAATIAGAADLPRGGLERPEMDKQVYRVLIPHTSEDELTKELYERSAVNWADMINVPLHLQHGDADDRVNVQDSIDLAAELEKYGKKHELVIYEGADHFMSNIRDQILENADKWFKSFS